MKRKTTSYLLRRIPRLLLLIFMTTLINSAFAQGISVTGTITSDEDEGGLPGVNVIVKGTSQGTVTDLDGNYDIVVPDQEATLVFRSEERRVYQ